MKIIEELNKVDNELNKVIMGKNFNFSTQIDINKILTFDWNKIPPCKYAMIVHDLDVQDTGELKPEHIHVVLQFEKKQRLSSVSKWFNIASNMIEITHNQKAIERYLIHHDNDDKHKYCVDDVISNYNWQDCLLEQDCYSVLFELTDIIENGQISSIIQLIKLLRCEYPKAYIDYVVQNTYLVSSIIRDNRNAMYKKTKIELSNGVEV